MRFSALAVLLAGLSVSASDWVDNGPGRLSDLIRASDYIVVASCVRTQSVDVFLHTLQFAVHQQIKGKLDSFTLQLVSGAAGDSPAFQVLAQPRSALVFLKGGPGQAPQLTTDFSVVALNGPDATLPAVIARKLEINAMPGGPAKTAALERLILPLLAAGGDSYIKESLAEDLLDLCRAQPALRLTAPELGLLFRAATNTAAYKVAVPLALVLDQQGAPQADEACLHALLDTAALTQDRSLRLAPVLAKRPQLRESYLKKIEQTQDPGRIGGMITHLYQLDPDALGPVYERLWKNNPATRPAIQNALKQSPAPEQADLLRRLTAQPGQR